MSVLATKLLMDVLDPQKESFDPFSVSAQDILDAYVRTVSGPLGLVKVPSGGHAKGVFVAAGIATYDGPDLVYGSDLRFSKLAPRWAVALYRTWAMRVSSLVYTEQRITDLLRDVRQDKAAQVEVDAVDRMGGIEGVYGWAKEQMVKRGIADAHEFG